MTEAAGRVPAVQQITGAVLLTGPGLADASALVSFALRTLQQRDQTTSLRWQILERVLTRAAADQRRLSLQRQQDDDDPALQAISDQQRLTTADAARLLGVTPRTVQRRAGELGGQRLGRIWLFDRAGIAAYTARPAA